jgi:hypothetical protein
MDHLDAMLLGNFDDFVASKVSSDWGEFAFLADLVCLVGLCDMMLASLEAF